MTRKLAPESLRATCDPATLGFRTTVDLEPPEGIIGQERAMSATDFGIAMKAPGYNLFVVGPPATGKSSTMKSVFTRTALAEPTPPDYCYVHNFEDPYRPRAIELPPGRGRELRDDLARVVAALDPQLTRTFDSDEFLRRSKALSGDLEKRSKAIMRRLEQAARREGFTIKTTSSGVQMSLSPDGKPLSDEQFAALPPAERERIEARAQALEAEADPLVRELRQLERDADAGRDKLIDESALAVARDLLADVRARFTGVAVVTAFLDRVEKDIVEHAWQLAEVDDPGDAGDEPDDDANREWAPSEARPERFEDRYRVNLFVDRDGEKGAPVVIEPNPSYRNLFGRLEHRVHLGTLVTDFMLLKPGALHRANGGYLLLEAKDLVADPFAWDALKKALKSSSIRIEEPLEEMHMLSAASLAPEPVPLQLKVVLLGAPDLFYMLDDLDEDFRELFKVKADFDDAMPRTPETERLFARFVAGAAKEHDLRPLSAGGVARVIEHAARVAEHQKRLSAKFGDLVDLLREASFFAGRRDRALVEADDVQFAIDQKAYRANLIEEQLARMTEDGEIYLGTDGEAVGQVNGLEVFEIGDHAFGRPFRITARVRPGKPGVIDVEREVGLGGALHSKGVLILGGFIAGRYAREAPLAMAATLVAEQTYDLVDGDSASCGEACALLSALAEAPISQALAITGSINQQGQVQPIGGVNEKVEGFFDLCRARGLTGKQGVIVPASNAQHLMLRTDVIAAVSEDRFFVRAVATIDEAMAALTGREAGERGDDGSFPAGTLNAAIEARLERFARAVRRAGDPG